MPIFEYVCRACGRPFEKLVFSDHKVECPACRSEDVEKQLSAFATSSSSETVLPDCRAEGCGLEQGGCGSGRCGCHHD